ncbi:MAG: hypothetical protein WC269_04760, partial [Candidatus Gracilibacteria bacterium]
MNIKQLDAKLSGYKFLSESGRACWYCYAYQICRQAVELGTKEWEINYGKIDTPFGSYSSNHIVKWFFVSKDLKQFTNFIRRYISNPKLLEYLKNDIEDLKNRIIALVGYEDFSRYSNKELGFILSRYFDLYKLFFKATMSLRTIDRGVIATIRQDFPSDKADEIIRTVSITNEPSFSLREEIAILNLAVITKEKELNLNSAEIEKGVKELVDKYAWSVLGYYKEQSNTENGYKNRLAELIKENPRFFLDNLNLRLKEDNKKSDALLKEFSHTQKKIAHIASMAAYLKDFVKSRINESQYRSEQLFMEIAIRIGKSTDFVKD